MRERIHKRLSKDFVEMVLESFSEGRISEIKACELLGLKRTRLYGLKKRWLNCLREEKQFKLWAREKSAFHRFPEEVEIWLHQQLWYIRNKAKLYRGNFNFALLAEEAEKVFGYPFQRNSLRLFALREGYYHGLPEEKHKLYVRFETSGPGVLFQHDSSYHLWIPYFGRKQYLILTQDDYSRRVVGGKIVEKETTWEHLQVAKETVVKYGLPLAYYVDQHSIFRFVEHRGVHVTYTRGLDEGEIQFKRALNSLGIGLIYTGKGKAEAKGKIEKRFDYFQRRVPFLCEKYNVKAIEEAGKVLEECIYFYNEKRVHEETKEIPLERWTKGIREGRGKLRPVNSALDLDVIFSLHSERIVSKDGVVSFMGRLLKVNRFPKERVKVCLVPEKKIIILRNEQKIYEEHL